MKRGQEVWVKVVAISGERLTLSMRDVDQATGEDLLPGARLGAEGVNPSAPPSNAAANNSLKGLSGIRVRLVLPACLHDKDVMLCTSPLCEPLENAPARADK